MRDLYSDDPASVGVDSGDRLIPSGMRKLAGAAVFLALVAALGLWSYRLGTRDATELPIIRAMEGSARVKPKDPGGVQAAHQGLEVNTVLAGKPAPMPRDVAPAEPVPAALEAEDAPQGELVLATPAVLAERVLGEDGDLAMPPADEAVVPPETPDPAAMVAALPEAAAETPEPTDAAAEPRPRNRPANLARPKPAAPRPTEAVITPVAATAPGAREVSGLSSGARLVQLGAFDSEEITRKAWSQLVARNGDLLSAKSLYVERTTANARVFYRLRVAGFTNSEETRQMCEALRARGIDCIPVTLQ